MDESWIFLGEQSWRPPEPPTSHNKQLCTFYNNLYATSLFRIDLSGNSLSLGFSSSCTHCLLRIITSSALRSFAANDIS
jgi:hypothetical protein